MTKVVNVHEAKTHLSRLLEEVHAGHEIILAKGGKPYAKLVPIGPAAPRRLGFLKMKVPADFFEPLPEDELKRWER
jgi:prevent-host-death family protein